MSDNQTFDVLIGNIPGFISRADFLGDITACNFGELVKLEFFYAHNKPSYVLMRFKNLNLHQQVVQQMNGIKYNGNILTAQINMIQHKKRFTRRTSSMTRNTKSRSTTPRCTLSLLRCASESSTYYSVIDEPGDLNAAKCPLCVFKFKELDVGQMRILRCGHVFCYDCLLKWSIVNGRNGEFKCTLCNAKTKYGKLTRLNFDWYVLFLIINNFE